MGAATKHMFMDHLRRSEVFPSKAGGTGVQPVKKWTATTIEYCTRQVPQVPLVDHLLSCSRLAAQNLANEFFTMNTCNIATKAVRGPALGHYLTSPRPAPDDQGLREPQISRNITDRQVSTAAERPSRNKICVVRRWSFGISLSQQNYRCMPLLSTSATFQL